MSTEGQAQQETAMLIKHRIPFVSCLNHSNLPAEPVSFNMQSMLEKLAPRPWQQQHR
jgi:hypothetical protein